MEGEEFEAFFARAEPRLRRALVAGLGSDVGRDAAAEALAWAWEHWDRVRTFDNPLGYLYRVGRSRSRRRRQGLQFRVESPDAVDAIEPGLVPALLSLTEHQRVVVVLVHGYGWSHREVGELLHLTTSTVQTHLERALAKLRDRLEVTSDA